jgi:hypothetical protein
MDQNLDRLLLGANKFPAPNGDKVAPVSVDMALGKVDDDHKDANLREHYTWLSDFVHPNGPALNYHHQTLDEAASTVTFRKLVPIDARFASQIYPTVAMCLHLAKDAWTWMFAFRWA